ncbi:MAG: hypothetical protein KJ592_02605 [Nanoarchaeota archaeon]|nr:hypothetical protein [Nanoarchaeota archaeon]
MVKRKKRLEKQIKGLARQSEIHDYKIKNEAGKFEETVDYWVKEKEGYDRQIEEKMERLRKMRREKEGGE